MYWKLLVACHVPAAQFAGDRSTTDAAETAEVVVKRQVTVAKPQRHGGSVDFLHHAKTPDMQRAVVGIDLRVR